MSPETGRRFGPYEIQARLGGGGMGHVYQAWDARLHREVAVKLLQDEFAMPGMRERFLREARAASALNHPNICTIFDIGEQDGDPYLVMELLHGETLRDRIQSRTMRTEEIVCVAKDVAEALGAAHAKGIIHRDIKPANIFLVDRQNANLQAKVLDFGLAKIEGGALGARSSRAMDITTAGSTVGTLAYMSPEQARGELLDSRSDLFSLGVVLYEMATRHVPFQGATSALVFVKLLNHPPEPVRDWNEAIPRDLEKIIFKLLAKERTARFQTAQELNEALDTIGEKSAGGWLRKAVSTVPLVRAADPVAREKRTSKRRHSGEIPFSREADAPPANDATPRSSSEAPHFLRPVARVPRGDVQRQTPVPGSESDPPPGSSPDVPKETRVSADVVANSNADAPSAILPDRLVPTIAARLAHSTDRQIPHTDGLEQKQRGDAPLEEGSPVSKAEWKISRVRGAWRNPRLRSSVAFAVLLSFLLLAMAIYRISHGRFGPPVLTEEDAIVVTQIENQTGDKVLDGVVAQGLQIALEQSPYLRLRGSDSYLVAVHQQAERNGEPGGAMGDRNVAARLHTVAFLNGTISGQTSPYVIHLDLRKTSSNEIMTSVEARVASLGEVPGAIDRLGVDLRSNVGEDGDSISRTENPLTREATGNVDALHAYAQGEALYFGGSVLEALASYQQAATLDPRFTQAYLRLVTIYRRMRAEVEAGDAARSALAGSNGASERTRTFAQYEYEMNASGDYARATSIIRHFLLSAPRDAEALNALARALRLQGHMADALQFAQQAYGEDPYSPEAYMQAEAALIGLDRFDAAYQLETQVAKLGLAHPGGDLTAAYLEDRQPLVDSAIAAIEANKAVYTTAWPYGLFLDNSGQFVSAAALWRTHAASAAQVPGLASSAAFLLSQGALDRALAGACEDALVLAGQAGHTKQGATSLFNTAMAAALCGDSVHAQSILRELQQSYPQSFAVSGFYLADIQAAIALFQNDPSAALDALKSARQYDLISLTPYLRGRAHVALRQTQFGIVDYQTVLAHRGIAFISGSNVYPLAEIGIARAFADTGDLGNSAQAYRRFLELWRHADPSQPLLAEAQAHTQELSSVRAQR